MTYHWEYGIRGVSGIRDVTGIVTVVQEPTVPNYSPVREIQLITWNETPNAGTFKIQTPSGATRIPSPGGGSAGTVGPFHGGVTGNISWKASSATIKTELDYILGQTVLGNDFLGQYNVQIGKTSGSIKIWFPYYIGVNPAQLNFPLLEIIDNTLTAGTAGGTAPVYTDSTDEKTAPDNSVDLSDEIAVDGLVADTEYNVRLVATNAIGTTYGPNQVVKTTSGGSPVLLLTPEISAEAIAGLDTSASLSGNINPNGGDTTFQCEFRPALEGDEFNQFSHIGFRCGVTTDTPDKFIFDGFFAGVLPIGGFIPLGWKAKFINRLGGQTNGLINNVYTIDTINAGNNSFKMKTASGSRVSVANPGSYDACLAVAIAGSSLIRINTPVTVGQPFRLELPNAVIPSTLQGKLYVKEIVDASSAVHLIKVARTLGGAEIICPSDVFAEQLDLASPNVVDRDGNTGTGYINFTQKLRAYNMPEASIFSDALGFEATEGEREVNVLLKELTPETDYEGRLTAINSIGRASGDWTAFTTAAIPDNFGSARVLPMEFVLTELDGSRRYVQNGTANGKPKYSPRPDSTPIGTHDSDIRWDGAAWVDDDGEYSADAVDDFLQTTDSAAEHAGWTIDSVDGIARSTNIGATLQSSEPLHAGEIGGHSIWLKFTAPKDGTLSLNTIGSTFDTLLAIYHQAGSGFGGLVEVASNDDIDDVIKTSSLEGFVAGGDDYYIAVDGKTGATGKILLNWSLA